MSDSPPPPDLFPTSPKTPPPRRPLNRIISNHNSFSNSSPHQLSPPGVVSAPSPQSGGAFSSQDDVSASFVEEENEVGNVIKGKELSPPSLSSSPNQPPQPTTTTTTTTTPPVSPPQPSDVMITMEQEDDENLRSRRRHRRLPTGTIRQYALGVVLGLVFNLFSLFVLYTGLIRTRRFAIGVTLGSGLQMCAVTLVWAGVQLARNGSLRSNSIHTLEMVSWMVLFSFGSLLFSSSAKARIRLEHYEAVERMRVESDLYLSDAEALSHFERPLLFNDDDYYASSTAAITATAGNGRRPRMGQRRNTSYQQHQQRAIDDERARSPFPLYLILSSEVV
eukprot:PhM_4_TR1304/c0_g1_i2/m.96905